MRFWGKIKIEDAIKKDVTLEADSLEQAVEKVCTSFDLSKPIICAKHHAEIKNFFRTVFYADDFVESVFFETLEIEIIGDKK